MSALRERAAIASREGTSRSHLEPCRAGRWDTLVASAVLVALVAGWGMDFEGPRLLVQSIKNLQAHSSGIPEGRVVDVSQRLRVVTR